MPIRGGSGGAPDYFSNLFGTQAVVAPAANQLGLAVVGKQGAADDQPVFEVWDDDFNTDQVLYVYHGGEVQILENSGSTHNVPTLTVLGNNSANDKLSVQKSGTGSLFTVDTDGNLVTHGTLVAANIPTSDPHIAGALYSVAGIVHVSAG